MLQLLYAVMLLGKNNIVQRRKELVEKQLVGESTSILIDNSQYFIHNLEYKIGFRSKTFNNSI
jgi:hypothetical protein